MSGSGLASVRSMLLTLQISLVWVHRKGTASIWRGWVSLAKGLLALCVTAKQPAPLPHGAVPMHPAWKAASDDSCMPMQEPGFVALCFVSRPTLQ